MASELALNHLKCLPGDSIVLDPMCGSGTVLRMGSELGLKGIGFDLDPLAVLVSTVWTTQVDLSVAEASAKETVNRARELDTANLGLPWIDDCDETTKFVNFWFEPKQIVQLRALSFVVAEAKGPVGDLLRVALSRTIITKEKGASIARDTSHSRPHRWFFNNDFEVYAAFERAFRDLKIKLKPERLSTSVTIARGDARSLHTAPTQSVDAIVTSPPYLNAIDYMRGHRLALVWLGYRISALRSIRSANIGSESQSTNQMSPIVREWIAEATEGDTALPNHHIGVLQRYAEDLVRMSGEQKRIIRNGGAMTVVIGDSRIKGVFIQNSLVVQRAAEAAGFTLVDKCTRALPTNRRYLPIGTGLRKTALDDRMTEEVVLLFGTN